MTDDNVTRQKPLTAEEEAEWRRWAALPPSLLGRWMDADVGRLFATLDAVRATLRAEATRDEHDDRHPLDGSKCHASRLHVHGPDGTVEWKS